MIVGQLDRAIGLLEQHQDGVDGPTDEHTVHELRKTLKRLRALMRLLRDPLGRKRFARENAVLRNCARSMAGARDAEVMVGTLDALVRRHPELAASSARANGGILRLRAEFVTERERAAITAHEPVRRSSAIAELRAMRARVLDWELRERPRDPAKLMTPGIERLYRKGRRRLRRARRRRDVDAMHAWRKSVKDLRYIAETLDRGSAGGGAMVAGHAAAAARTRKAAKRRTKNAKRLRRVAHRADRLGDILGEEHDLALLAGRVRKRAELFAGDRHTRKALLKRIERRRRRLQRQALREGERLYERKPQAFVRRLRRAL